MKAYINRLILSMKFRPITEIIVPAILLAGVPVALFLIISTSRMKNIFVDNYVQNVRLQTSQYSESFEAMIDSVLETMHQVYGDQELYAVMNKQEFKYSDKRYLQRKVIQIANSNSYVDSVYIKALAADMVASTNRGVEIAEEFNDNAIFEWMDQTVALPAVSNTRTVRSIAKKNQEHVISVCARLPLESDRVHKGDIVLNIRQSTFAGRPFSLPGTESETYILGSENTVLFAGDESALYQSLDSLPFAEEIVLGADGYNVTDIEGVPTLLVYNRMPRRSWTFISVIPMQTTYSDINSLVYIPIYSLIAILLMAFLTSFTFSAWSFRSISDLDQMLKQHGNGNQIGQANKRNNIRRIVEQTVAWNQTLTERLEKMMPVYRERFLFDLVVRGSYGAQENQKRLEAFGIDIPLSGRAIALLEIDQFEEHDSSLQSNSAYILSIENFIAELLEIPAYHYFSVSTAPNRLIIASNISRIGFPSLVRMLEALNQKIWESLNTHTTILAYPLNDGESLNHAYEGCERLIRYKYILGTGKVIACDTEMFLSKDEKYSEDYSAQLEILEAYIRAREKMNALALLKEIILKIKLNGSMLYTKNYLISIQIKLFHLAKELRAIDESIENTMKCLLDSISRSYSLSEIEESFQQLITAIIDKISENRNPSKQMMEIIDDFIKANYPKQIGLSDLCEATGMSHTFLNRIIKDNTGDTFIQYLNKYRVQVACEMLANKEYRIQDVAERAGFASSKYFIKVFKNQKGVTPGEYRD